MIDKGMRCDLILIIKPSIRSDVGEAAPAGGPFTYDDDNEHYRYLEAFLNANDLLVH